MKELNWITNKLRYDINTEKSEIKNINTIVINKRVGEY